MENSPRSSARPRRGLPPVPSSNAVAVDAFTTRHAKRAAGIAVPLRSMRASSTPGRTATRTRRPPGCRSTDQGSSSASAALPMASAGTLITGCHAPAAAGTRSCRSGGTGANTECSCRRDAKRQRVPSASLRPVKSSHCNGNCVAMASPEANKGAEATSNGTASSRLAIATGCMSSFVCRLSSKPATVSKQVSGTSCNLDAFKPNAASTGEADPPPSPPVIAVCVALCPALHSTSPTISQSLAAVASSC
mmetsp:Transcript_54237/g.108012  ORF Transcript_54237/g.108012 Transcript_54237/m.108012 type:complete len:249 (-) Transcript_54237:234-980(-)